MKGKVDWFRVIVILGGGLGLVLFLIRCADAGEADLTWTAPTMRCNGTPLTNLQGYGLTWGQNRVDLPLDLAHTVTGLKPGTWWFSLAAIDADGERSEFVTVEKVVAPEEFVTTSTTIYTFVKADGKILVLPTLHTVALGVQCDATQSVNGKYVIPREAVTWSGTARPVTVVGDCG